MESTLQTCLNLNAKLAEVEQVLEHEQKQRTQLEQEYIKVLQRMEQIHNENERYHEHVEDLHKKMDAWRSEMLNQQHNTALQLDELKSQCALLQGTCTKT